MEKNDKSTQAFVQRFLPWIVGAAALVIYACTVSRWITFRGAGDLARVVGWEWRPTFFNPLYFILTYPIPWLPASAQLIGFNFFSAICSALSLVMLVRSVALLPHDRTKDQRSLERSEFSLLSLPSAWVPAAFAALIMLFHRGLWENSIIGSVESLDLLIFAYLVRCLLEYRLAPKPSWLMRMAFVYGAGVTNNFALIAFAPAFAVAVVWTVGRKLWNLNLLLKLFLLGLAGLSLYLLLPMIISTSGLEGLTFWEALKMNLGYQKRFVMGYPKLLIFLMSVTSVLPVIFMGIRWPATFGDINAAGNALTNLTMYVIHAIFLLLCIYAAFDTSFSPRELGGGYFAFLPLYYLGALSIGYYSGYFLLTFKPSAPLKAWQRPSLLRRVTNVAVISLIYVVALAVPIALVVKNYPLLQVARGKDLAEFGVLAAKSLPPEGGIILSDDPFRLYTLASALQQQGNASKYVLVETASLNQQLYHKFLRQKYGNRWPELPLGAQFANAVPSIYQNQILFQLEKTTGLYYLHPSFGYFFESFYATPQHSVSRLRPIPAGEVSGPVMAAPEISENVNYWQALCDSGLKHLLRTELKKKRKSKGLQEYVPAEIVGSYYSQMIDLLGVESQRAGDFATGAACFARAVQLNPQNPCALLNLEYAQARQNGLKALTNFSEKLLNAMAPYQGAVDRLLGDGGPIDEPQFNSVLAGVFERGNNFRQAAQKLLRYLSEFPNELGARASLARVYIEGGNCDKGLELINGIRHESGVNLKPEERLELVRCEAWGYDCKHDLPAVEKIIQSARAEFPN
ncbi:MAG TPA: DUF2723 domain-containing protein, partial [Verrucomicrobiae bacterium]